VCVYVCVCVWERERERERKSHSAISTVRQYKLFSQFFAQTAMTNFPLHECVHFHLLSGTRTGYVRRWRR